MKSKDFSLYVNQIKQSLETPIQEDLIEKDYILSEFLSNWAKENTPNLDKLIFKGGTLLTKNYLKYHRISEDLDFIHQDSNEIKHVPSKSQRESQIKQRIIPILNEIEKIAKISKLDFQNIRTNSKYIIQKNSRSLYIIKLYYISQITKREDNIKFEISFVEELINKPKLEHIQNLLDIKIQNSYVIKRLTNYNLINLNLQVYPIDEIILEKIRATITRIQFKARDVFDLYLIHKQKSIFTQTKEDIFKKLNASPFEFEQTKLNIKQFISSNINVDLEDIYNLSLIEFNEKNFVDFSNKLIKYLKEIAQEFIEKH
ncbi:MAG: nucleotidyl transferase AbiEii/AbiGii toxin family protein [Candidatus Woesearchaeota archaeon]